MFMPVSLNGRLRDVARVAQRGVPTWPAVGAATATRAAIAGAVVGTGARAGIAGDGLADDRLADLRVRHGGPRVGCPRAHHQTRRDKRRRAKYLEAHDALPRMFPRGYSNVRSRRVQPPVAIGSQRPRLLAFGADLSPHRTAHKSSRPYASSWPSCARPSRWPGGGPIRRTSVGGQAWKPLKSTPARTAAEAP